MKKVLLTACITIVVMMGKVYAQKANAPMMTENLKWMQVSRGYPNNINTRAVRDFLKRNKTGVDAEWQIIDDGYVVRYAEGKKHCRTVYNRKGEFVYTIKQYSEELMPRDVRSVVKSRYFDYAITLVEEIERPSKPLAYVVHMEDAKTLLNVQVCDGELEVVGDYIKG